jgi:polar amino acid transport system substrate-binding protein
MFAMLASFLSLQFLAAVAALFALLLFVGTLLWLLERRQNGQHFDPRPLHGVADGVWWAAVTMTTTGYGDKVPVSWRGRSLALLWMFASMFLITFFSATLASSFVVGRLKTGISSPGDLSRARVAVVSGTAGELWLRLQGLSARKYPFVIQASKALQRGDVDALIYEKAILGHMIQEYAWRELQILPHTLAVRDYAIALPTDSPLKEPVNRALLKIVQGTEWKDVVQRYVGSAD